jgi:hypothetical protein
MFCVVVGLPSSFAAWCETVVLELMRRAGRSAELLHGDTLEQIALSAIRARAADVVVSSQQPGGRLRAALVGGGRNFIVARDDPRSALIDLVLGHSVALADAVQNLAGSCAALNELAAAPQALNLDAARDWSSPTETVSAIARHLRLAVDASGIAELAASCPAPPQYDAVSWWNGLAASEQELVVGALAPYVDATADSEPLSVIWRSALFFLGDRPAERAGGPVDITGRARCLLHGPYIRLMPGAWSLSLTVRVTRSAADHEFTAEICTDRPLAAGVIRPHSEGSAELALDFTLDAATELPVVLRISSQRAAFDGAIEIVAARLVRTAPADRASAAPLLSQA